MRIWIHLDRDRIRIHLDRDRIRIHLDPSCEQKCILKTSKIWGQAPLIPVLDSIISDRYARTVFFIACLYTNVIDRQRFAADPDSTSIFTDQDPDPDPTLSFTHLGNSNKKFLEISIVKLYIWLKLIWIRQKDADPDLYYSRFDGQAGRSDG